MGITIHYRGQLRDPASLTRLSQEMEMACGRLGWPCRTIDERVLGLAEQHHYEEDPDGMTVHVRVETTPLEDRWRGVVIEPPECETMWLTFNRSGQLIVYDLPLEEPETPGRYHAREYLWVKTQFSTPEVHIAICDLLRQVAGYMAWLEVHDEGGYWESGDRETLVERLEMLNTAMSALASDDGLGVLGELLGREVKGPVEVGKRIEQRLPPWRRDWGVSAEEN